MPSSGSTREPTVRRAPVHCCFRAGLSPSRQPASKRMLYRARSARASPQVIDPSMSNMRVNRNSSDLADTAMIWSASCFIYGGPATLEIARGMQAGGCMGCAPNRFPA